MDHYKEFLEAQGQAELAAVAVTSQQWEAGFDLEALPDIPQADLPPQLSQVCHRWQQHSVSLYQLHDAHTS